MAEVHAQIAFRPHTQVAFGFAPAVCRPHRPLPGFCEQHEHAAKSAPHGRSDARADVVGAWTGRTFDYLDRLGQPQHAAMSAKPLKVI